VSKAREALRDRKARVPPAARLAAEKVIVTVLSIILMLAAGMTAYAVFMVRLERTVPWVLSVLAITATLGFVMSRFEKRWKKAEREMGTAAHSA